MNKPKGDTTSARRQANRREALNEIAQSHGFDSWTRLETAVINGNVFMEIAELPPKKTPSK